MGDVRIERMVERVELCVGAMGLKQAKVPGNLSRISASEGRLSYTPSVECLSQLKVRKTQPVIILQLFFLPFLDYVMLTEKRCQALPAFPYCKRWKAGRGLRMRLVMEKKNDNLQEILIKYSGRNFIGQSYSVSQFQIENDHYISQITQLHCRTHQRWATLDMYYI